MDSMKPLNKFFDHTILSQTARVEDVRNVCKEAIHYDFFSVCVNSGFVPFVAKELRDTDVRVTSVIGFPLGATSTPVKRYEALEACEAGADEIDMVMNLGALREANDGYVTNEIAAISTVCQKHHAKLKVIIESNLLYEAELIKACQLAANGGADYVKTCTGFSKGGATVEAVRLMKNTLQGRALIKASGGIRDLKTAREMIEAGADRLGASASVNIMKEYLNY